jgi:hypothetical protein
MQVAYDILVRNDQARSNSFNFSYSTDNTTYTPVAALDYASPLAADPAPITIQTVPRSTTLTGLSVPNGGYIYFRWSGADAGGNASAPVTAPTEVAGQPAGAGAPPVPSI